MFEIVIKGRFSTGTTQDNEEEAKETWELISQFDEFQEERNRKSKEE